MPLTECLHRETMHFVNDRTFPTNESPPPQSGRQAFAELLRNSIPKYGTHGALQDWLDARGLAADMTSSELGRYAQAKTEPKTDRLRLLARGMNFNFEYVRGVLEGTSTIVEAPPPAGDEVIELAALLERAAALAHRLTIQHAQAMRQRRTRRSKKGVNIHSSMDTIATSSFVLSTSA